MSTENNVWKSFPSQVTNILTFMGITFRIGGLCLSAYLLDKFDYIQPYIDFDMNYFYVGTGCFAIILYLWSWLVVSMTEYKLTDERFILKTGVFNRMTDELELYRVKDYRLDEPFVYRLFGLGNIILQTSDQTHSNLQIKGIKNGAEILSKIRQNVEIQRRLKGVREIDM